MNFQNFYILIFKDLNKQAYLNLLFIILFIIMILIVLLQKLDIPVNNNDILRKYQLSKVHNKNFLKVDTLVLGDSSAGNAINNKYMSKLLNKNVENLSLTGDWGILGSLGMLKRSLEKNKQIRNVYLIHTLDIWERDFPKHSVLELLPLKEKLDYLKLNEIINFYINPKEIYWLIKFYIKKNFRDNFVTIDKENDYLKQNNEKYSNKKNVLKENFTLNNLKINKSKIRELKDFVSFCNKNDINYIFIQGPIHYTVYNNSLDYINKIREFLKSENVNFIEKPFYYKNNMIGDSIDHIDVKFKDKVTYDYYKEIIKFRINNNEKN